MTDKFAPKKISKSGLSGVDDFINIIESSFRKYPLGMRNYIESELKNASAGSLKLLVDAIMKSDYAKDSPPKYSEIVKIARRAGVNLSGTVSKIGAWHCKKCNALYPIVDSFSTVCTKNVNGKKCGCREFDVAMITADDANFSYIKSETARLREKEETEIRAVKMDYFSKIVLNRIDKSNKID